MPGVVLVLAAGFDDPLADLHQVNHGIQPVTFANEPALNLGPRLVIGIVQQSGLGEHQRRRECVVARVTNRGIKEQGAGGLKTGITDRLHQFTGSNPHSDLRGDECGPRLILKIECSVRPAQGDYATKLDQRGRFGAGAKLSQLHQGGHRQREQIGRGRAFDLDELHRRHTQFEAGEFTTFVELARNHAAQPRGGVLEGFESRGSGQAQGELARVITRVGDQHSILMPGGMHGGVHFHPLAVVTTPPQLLHGHRSRRWQFAASQPAHFRGLYNGGKVTWITGADDFDAVSRPRIRRLIGQDHVDAARFILHEQLIPGGKMVGDHPGEAHRMSLCRQLGTERADVGNACQHRLVRCGPGNAVRGYYRGWDLRGQQRRVKQSRQPAEPTLVAVVHLEPCTLATRRSGLTGQGMGSSAEPGRRLSARAGGFRCLAVDGP